MKSMKLFLSNQHNQKDERKKIASHSRKARDDELLVLFLRTQNSSTFMTLALLYSANGKYFTAG